MKTEIKSFRDLRVWQNGMNLVEQVYRLNQTFPNYEQYGLTNQIHRAAISIPSNIAEGHTREHGNEYRKYLSVVQGSLSELQTQFEIAARLEYVSIQQVEDVLNNAMALTKQIYALRNALAKLLTPNPL